MKNRHILIFLATLLASGSFAQSAGTPGYTTDPHWYQDFSRCDEFNFLDLNRWEIKNNFDHYENNWVARTNNVSVTNGALKLDFKKEQYTCPPGTLDSFQCANQYLTGDSYSFTTGYVQSKFDVGYGYVEARIKVPSLVGMNAAYWLLSIAGIPYGEVDIFEDFYGTDFSWDSLPFPGFPAGFYSPTEVHGKFRSTSNIHAGEGVVVPSEGGYFFVAEVPNYNLWHVYGLEMTSQKLIWYIDGVKVREEFNHLESDRYNVIFNLGGYSTEDLAPGEVKSLEMDYFRYYPLQEDCNVINQVLFNFATNDHKVKNWIQIGDATSVNQVGKKNGYLRAKEFIQINGTFTVPLGKEFVMYPNDCY